MWTARIGKTTTTAKLAHFFQKKPHHKKVLVAACDLQRPAAIEQLQTLSSASGVSVFLSQERKILSLLQRELFAKAKEEKFDVLIVDTAGRLHVDAELMDELHRMKEVLCPHEILFVASAHTGQDAATVAQAFNQQMAVTGTVLTMLDGTSRAGAALSIREVTKKPLKFEGVGEKIRRFTAVSPPVDGRSDFGDG